MTCDLLDVAVESMRNEAERIRDRCLRSLIGAAKTRMDEGDYKNKYEKAVLELAGPHVHVRSHDPRDVQARSRYEDAMEVYPSVVDKIARKHLSRYGQAVRRPQTASARRARSLSLARASRSEGSPRRTRSVPPNSSSANCNRGPCLATAEFGRRNRTTYMREAGTDCDEKIRRSLCGSITVGSWIGMRSKNTEVVARKARCLDSSQENGQRSAADGPEARRPPRSGPEGSYCLINCFFSFVSHYTGSQGSQLIGRVQTVG